MENTICYIIIYILEAFILQQYCSELFYPRHSKTKEYLLLFNAYAILFFISLLENIWINLFAFLTTNFIIILALYHIKWLSALFHSAIITIVMGLSELVVLGITSYSSISYYAEQTYFRNFIILTILSKLIYFFILHFIVRLLHGTKEKYIPSDKGIIFLDIIPLISSFINITFIAIYLNTKLSFILDCLISISAILLLLLNLFIYRIYDNNRKKNYEFMELQLQLQKEYDNAEYYKMLLKQDEEQKILIHDIKKHLHSISTLNEQNERQKINAYINQLIHSSSLQESVSVCDNELLNAILYRYIRSCNEKQITLRADVRKGLLTYMSYDDLTALFCNLLDNAVEAATKVSDSYIDLSVTYNENATLTMLTMINSCYQNPYSDKAGKLTTTKQNHLRHGYGLKSIQRIVKKYHGNMQTYFDENSMTFHTILTLKAPDKNVPPHLQ